MIYCIISDIHSNIFALKNVIEDSKKFNVDKYVCIGDIVGYGPNPNECIELIQKLTDFVVAGNHDYACVEKLDYDDFNDNAKQIVEFTIKNLSDQNSKYLSELKKINGCKDFDIVHGAFSNPITDYLINVWIAYTNFKLQKKNLSFNGHTHKPKIFFQDKESKEVYQQDFEFGKKIYLNNNYKYIINSGSVGQPRDKDNRSSYIIYNSEGNYVICNRVEYDIKKVQDKMIENNFPEFLIKRLENGK